MVKGQWLFLVDFTVFSEKRINQPGLKKIPERDLDFKNP
jgi:hypothetical protein